MEDILKPNQRGWDLRVGERDVWTRPVSPEQIERARLGDWSLILTPDRPVPRNWFGDVIGRDNCAWRPAAASRLPSWLLPERAGVVPRGVV